jgi:hypothetical protein
MCNYVYPILNPNSYKPLNMCLMPTIMTKLIFYQNWKCLFVELPICLNKSINFQFFFEFAYLYLHLLQPCFNFILFYFIVIVIHL